MTPDLWVGFAVLAAVFALEGMIPFYHPRPRRLRHGLLNLSLALLNALVVALTAPLAVLAAEVARSHGLGILHWLGVSGLASTLAGIVAMDLWMYWWHRGVHRIGPLRRLHRVHHSDQALDSTTALRFHPVELLILALLDCLVILLFGLDLTAFVLYLTLMITVVLIHHANIAFPAWLDRQVRRLLVAPSMHRIHHSDIRAETDSNYGSVFSFWDRIFATYRARDDQSGICFGLGAFGERRWRTPEGLLLLPLAPTAERRAPDT